MRQSVQRWLIVAIFAAGAGVVGGTSLLAYRFMQPEASHAPASAEPRPVRSLTFRAPEAEPRRMPTTQAQELDVLAAIAADAATTGRAAPDDRPREVSTSQKTKAVAKNVKKRKAKKRRTAAQPSQPRAQAAVRGAR